MSYFENQVKSNTSTLQEGTHSWRDPLLDNMVKIFAGKKEVVEFEQINEQEKVVKPRSKPRTKYKWLKRILRFIVFGIENALLSKKIKQSEVPNDFENRFKSN